LTTIQDAILDNSGVTDECKIYMT